jgi:3-isopropylmalate dehydrogenase
MPTVSRLWVRGLDDLAKDSGVHCEVLQIDNAAYQLIHAAREFDVVVTTNLLGDILADCSALLLGSRGMSVSANFGRNRRAVYQTGHGAAYDLAGRDRANPVAQILSVAMLLRVSFGLEKVACCIESAVTRTLEAGWRTPDIAASGCRLVGTREMGRRIADAAGAMAAEGVT